MAESARSVETTARWCSSAAMAATSSRLVIPGPWHERRGGSGRLRGVDQPATALDGVDFPTVPTCSRSRGLLAGNRDVRQCRHPAATVAVRVAGAFSDAVFGGEDGEFVYAM